MSTHTIVQDRRFYGNKGFSEASPALLARLLITYREIAGDVTKPAILRAYAAVVITELRHELAHCDQREGRAA